MIDAVPLFLLVMSVIFPTALVGGIWLGSRNLYRKIETVVEDA